MPECLQELKGIADGSERELEEIIMLNARQDLAAIRHLYGLTYGDYSETPSFWSDSNLSAYFKGQDDRGPIVVQSWTKKGPSAVVPVVYLEVQPDKSEAFESQFIITQPGVLMMSAINASGLCITSNPLFSSLDQKLIREKDYLPLTCIQ